MHDVVTGHFVPNDIDQATGYQEGFGATINIYKGDDECGSSQESQEASNRISYYKEFLNYFGVSTSENMSCAGMAEF